MYGGNKNKKSKSAQKNRMSTASKRVAKVDKLKSQGASSTRVNRAIAKKKGSKRKGGYSSF
jgi:hypothetical protein